MIPTRCTLFFLLLALSIPSLTKSKRRSRIKKAERIELRKKVVITDDQRLSDALGKQIKFMKFDDAVLAMNYYIKEQDLDIAIKVGQRAVAVGPDQKADAQTRARQEELLRQIRFKLAELFLEKRKLKEAEDSAREYQKFYPGTTESIKAEYIIIRANFLGQSQSDRDQKNTHTTIEKAQAFLDKYPQNESTQIIKEMLDQSYQTLIRSEINIINTMLTNYNYTKTQAFLDAAVKRVEYIKEKYLPHATITQKRVLEVELELAKLTGKPLAEIAKPTDAPKSEKKDTVVLASRQSQGTILGAIKGVFVENNQEYFA